MITEGAKVRYNAVSGREGLTGIVFKVITEGVNSPVAVVRDANGREHCIYTWALTNNPNQSQKEVRP